MISLLRLSLFRRASEANWSAHVAFSAHRPCPLSGWIGRRYELWRHLAGGPERRVIEPARYSLVAGLTACASSSLLHCYPGVDRCLFASATIRLASTANPSRQPGQPQCTRPPRAQTRCGRCRYRGSAHCAHARMPNDPVPCPQWRARKDGIGGRPAVRGESCSAIAALTIPSWRGPWTTLQVSTRHSKPSTCAS